jgi:hypothetical protein
MSARTIQVNYNTRPVRLAFLLDKPDPSTLEKVFSLNTVLWGGSLNPVVILDGSTRKQVGAHYAYEDSTYDQEQLWLLKAFDPDILINYSNSPLPDYLAPFKERIFPVEVMKWDPWGTEETSAFLEVWPFLQQYWSKEFRFLQKPKERYGYIDLEHPAELRTFLVARFGNYPGDGNGNMVLASNFDGKLVTYHEEFRRSFSIDEWIFPIHITTFQIGIPFPSSLDNHILFLMDAENIFDIVDYWNLRAAGYRIFPLPTLHYQDFPQSAKIFAERSVYPINKNLSTNPELVKGRSVEDSQWEEAGKWFASLGISAETVRLKGWVPRFRGWGRDRRVSPEMQIRSPVSEDGDEVVVFNEWYGSLRTTAPDCELRGPYFSQHWAAELRVLGAASEDGTFKLPWLHPECDALVERKIGHGYKPYSSRVSKHGIVVLLRGNRENLTIEEPKLTEVLQAYLKDGGFTYLKVSTPGLTLERIIEQLGGLLPCTVLQNPGVRELIEKLANGSRTPANDVRRIIHKSLRTDKAEKQKEFNSILSRLVEKSVLRQGFELQCQRCQRHDWYHMSDLGTEFRCKKCFHVQQVPNLDGMPWWYVSDGLFRLEGKVAGCLTTILSLLFLNHFVGHGVKYVPSFDYADGAILGERDFAVLASDFLQEDVDVIIGECKSLKDVEENQRTAIRRLGEKTGAYLAFCTLCNEFRGEDKLFFEQLVAAGQRPILLTSKHLEMPYLEISKYRHARSWLGRKVELISRLSIRETLGGAFADEHGRRI